MTTFNMHQAKTHFSKLVHDVEEGKEVIIAKSGKPVAKIIPFTASKFLRVPGRMKGKFTVPDDFDDPLPDEILNAFSGEGDDEK